MKTKNYLLLFIISFFLVSMSLLLTNRSQAQQTLLPSSDYIIAPEMPEQTELLRAAQRSDACVVADVAILFTDDATEYIGISNASRWAANRIAETNRSLRNSDICHRVRLVHVAVNIGPSSGDFIDIYDLGTTRWQEWGPTGSMRTSTGSDYTVLISSPSQGAGGKSLYCGLGFVPNSFNLGFAEYAKATVSADCGGLVTAHELGHTFGGMHDVNTSPECVDGPLLPNSCGGLLPDHRAITTMSYFQSGYVIWIEHYSNPDVMYNGEPTGQNSTQNNANTIREGLGFFHAMLPQAIANDVSIDNTVFAVEPNGSQVTLSGTVLIANSNVKTSLGQAITSGNTWYLTTFIDPSIASIELQVNDGMTQVIPLDVQIASVTISGTISESLGTILTVTPDLGIPTVTDIQGNYEVAVVPGVRTLTVFSLDLSTSLLCSNTVTVEAYEDTIENFSVTCNVVSQNYLPLVSK